MAIPIISAMHEGQPSRTAQEVARIRASHQLLDLPPVFVDPLAARITGHETEAALQKNPHRFRTGAFIRAFIAVRSRFAEDQLARAVDSGVRQYVIVGAGLDTFAYRNPHADLGLRVFEVDHPASQTWKRRRLTETDIGVPDSLSFVPVDLARDKLDQTLHAAGFRADQPAFLSMLGVVIFMPQPTVTGILSFAASLPPGSGLAFDYGASDKHLNPNQRAMREMGARQSAAAGEPFLTFLDPQVLETNLRQMGFNHIDSCGPAETNQRYFTNRTDGLRVGPGGRRIIGAHR
jgi:methyltransferase (TIGR00027 family)